MISNYKNINNKNHNKINSFYDSNEVSLWAKDSVEGVLEKGYMYRYDGDNTFRPKANITRAEAVAILNRTR